MPVKRVIEYTGMMPEFWKLKVTAGINNIRNQLIWHA
jgi:hypothetical protein